MQRDIGLKLAGEILTHIDVDADKNEILLTLRSGKQVLVYHEQDCCEVVRIEDTEGNWHDLLGKPLVAATLEEFPQGDPPPGQDPYSWTRTTLTFKVDAATVVSRWIGESNGCYSESIRLHEIAPTSPPR